MVISVVMLKSTPVICCSTIYIYGKISIVQLKTCPEVSVTYVLLGNTLSTSSTEHALIDSAITDLNIKTNNLLSEFSFSESTTLSRLFQSYCKNVYGSSLWKFNYHNNIERFCVSWRKVIRRIWKIPYRTHNALQWWQKESGPSAILSKKEQTRVKRPNKSRKTVNLYLKYNMYT